MSESHLNDLKFRLMTVNLLRMAKKNYTYRELSARTELPMTVLSRYVKGHVLPGSSRSRKIWRTLERLVGLKKELRRRIKFDELGYFDNTSIISDTALLQQASQYVFSKFAGRRITKVLTAAVDGIPLATLICNALGTDLIIAKKTKEVGVREFVEETFIPAGSAMIMSLYVSRGIIRRGDSVLIVDDVIKSGETQRAMINLVRRSRAEVAGIYALIAIGNQWKETLLEASGFPIEVVLNTNPKKT
jgi:adenine/guanine phosphoribosyltransferase-like PRPP-binding protein